MERDERDTIYVYKGREREREGKREGETGGERERGKEGSGQ